MRTAFIQNIPFVTIYTTFQKLEVSIFFFKEIRFIQQGFVKLIETVVKIDIVIKHLYFE